MKKNIVFVGMALAVIVMSSGMMGCAHSSHTRGSVALKHNTEEADVCLGKGEVNVGDRVSLFKSECKARTMGGRDGAGSTQSCSKIKLGEGEIVRVLDDHYSTIRVSSNVPFGEGTIVEKL